MMKMKHNHEIFCNEMVDLIADEMMWQYRDREQNLDNFFGQLQLEIQLLIQMKHLKDVQ